MSRYVGLKRNSDPTRSGFSGAMGEQAIVQQSLIAQKVMKAWTAENIEKVRKYRREVVTLRKVADGINEFLVNKEGMTLGDIQKIESEFNDRARIANDLMKDLAGDYAQRMIKAGVSTSLGYNFYDLRGPAFLIYPVNTPLRNSLARWGKTNAGYGTAVHWKYNSIGPGSGSGSQNYAGASEGNRVGTSLPNEIDAIATYAELGVERSVTFTAEFAGEGYTDNVADEHLRGLHELELQEESIMWGGNPGNGTGLNGFQLGTANTPSLVLAATVPAGAPNDGSTGGFTNNTTVSVRVIELTMLGYPSNAQYGYQAAPTVAAGLTPSYSRTQAGPYGGSDTINGGCGQVSASSAVVTAITSTPYVKASVVPKAGAIAWAWYVDTADASTPSAANAAIQAITTVPYVYLGNATPGAQKANATGLNGDHSNEALDFAGIMAWAVNNGIWINQSDISKNDPSTGSTNNGLLQPVELGTTKVPGVVQLDYDLEQQWNSFQTVGDEIWCDAATKLNINRAVMLAGNTNWRFDISRDQQNNILGSAVISAYTSPFSMKATGSDALPIRIHPMLPVGTIVYRKTSNPYPHSRIPGVDGMFVQRDYYGIEWPVNKRQWEFGTYVHETYGNYIPGLLTVRTGVQGVSTT